MVDNSAILQPVWVQASAIHSVFTEVVQRCLMRSTSANFRLRRETLCTARRKRIWSALKLCSVMYSADSSATSCSYPGMASISSTTRSRSRKLSTCRAYTLLRFLFSDLQISFREIMFQHSFKFYQLVRQPFLL